MEALGQLPAERLKVVRWKRSGGRRRSGEKEVEGERSRSTSRRWGVARA
jgi:hypothetical protein